MISRAPNLAVFLALMGCHAGGFGNFGAVSGGDSGSSSHDEDDDVDDVDGADDDPNEIGNEPAEVAGAFLTCDQKAVDDQIGCAVNGGKSHEKLDPKIAAVEFESVKLRHWLGETTVEPTLETLGASSPWHVLFRAPFGVGLSDVEIVARVKLDGVAKKLSRVVDGLGDGGSDDDSQDDDPQSVITPVAENQANLPGIQDCAEARAMGMTASGLAWILPFTADAAKAGGAAEGRGGEPSLVYCDQEADGGGWTLVYNAVPLSAGYDASFWAISSSDSLRPKGSPGLDTPYYDGLNYLVVAAREYYSLGEVRDVVVDKSGTEKTLYVGTVTDVDAATLTFAAPVLQPGYEDAGAAFAAHVAGPWLPSQDLGLDYEEDECDAAHKDVAQHYSPDGCWLLNLGSDAATDDDKVRGPHVSSALMTALGLSSDGSATSAVKRISRFVRLQESPAEPKE
jgi:hypothetical protein